MNQEKKLLIASKKALRVIGRIKTGQIRSLKIISDLGETYNALRRAIGSAENKK